MSIAILTCIIFFVCVVCSLGQPQPNAMLLQIVLTQCLSRYQEWPKLSVTVIVVLKTWDVLIFHSIEPCCDSNFIFVEKLTEIVEFKV